MKVLLLITLLGGFMTMPIIGESNPLNLPNSVQEKPSLLITGKESLESIRKSLAHLSDEERKEWVNSQDANGKTPLVFAIEGHTATSNKMDVITYLIEECQADPNLGDKDNWTPLYRAATGTHIEPLKYLLGHGANPNIANVDGSVPLHRAVDRGSMADVEMLIQNNADVNIVNVFGSPLAYAAKNGNIEIAKVLLNAGADINLVDDPLALNPLALAINNQNEEMQVFLSSRDGKEFLPLESDIHTDMSHLVQKGEKEAILKSFSPKDKDAYGRTVAHYAAYFGQTDILKELKGNIDQPDKKEKTPLHYAIIKGQTAMVQWLISDEGNASLISQDNVKYGPLMLAAQYNRENIARMVLERASEKNELNAVLSMKDKFGWTALHKAAQVGNVELVRLLVEEYKVDPFQLTSNGRTPLELAETTKATLVIRYFKDLKAKIADLPNKV